MDVKAGRYTANYLDGLLLSDVGVGMVMSSLAGAAVAHLPPIQYGVSPAFNQAMRQIGGTLGVALTILLLGKDVLSRPDFVPVRRIHIELALLTGLLCCAIQTRPAPQSLATEPTAPVLPSST